MSTESTAQLREFLVHVPDFQNVMTKRLALLKPHNKDAAPWVIAGRIPFFGSTLSQHGAEGEQPAENGTVMIIKAESAEEIKEFIKKDIFTVEGVWDTEHMTIWPYKSK